MRVPVWFPPAALLTLLACSSGSSDTVTPPEPIDQAIGVAAVQTFLGLETGSGIDGQSISLSRDEETLAASEMAGSTCVTRVWDVNSTPKTLTITYTNCTGTQGTLNGHVVYSLANYTDALHWSGTATFDYTAVDSSATKTWTYSGTRTVTRNNLSFSFVASNMAVAYRDTVTPSNNRSYTYSCNLTATWISLTQLQLFGNFSFTNITSNETVTGVIAPATPLVWNYTTCFCYPSSGTIVLTKDGKQGTFTFESCGVMKFNGIVTIPLPTCS